MKNEILKPTVTMTHFINAQSSYHAIKVDRKTTSFSFHSVTAMATAPARQLNNKVCTRFDIPSSLVLIKQVKEEKMLPILSVNEFTKIRLKT